MCDFKDGDCDYCGDQGKCCHIGLKGGSCNGEEGGDSFHACRQVINQTGVDIVQRKLSFFLSFSLSFSFPSFSLIFFFSFSNLIFELEKLRGSQKCIPLSSRPSRSVRKVQCGGWRDENRERKVKSFLSFDFFFEFDFSLT